MAVLEDGKGQGFSAETYADAMEMIWISNQDNIDDLPSNYTILDNSLLDFDGNFAHGEVDSEGYFHAGLLSPGGQAVAVVTDDGRIMVTFAGTNDSSDATSVFSFSDGTYLDGFERYLVAVAEFAGKNNYTIDLVTGKSLGGAATNILYERDDIASGAFSDAKFFGMAASYIADDSENLINFGYDNDYAYRFYQNVFGGLESGNPSGPEHLVFFNEEYADKDWSGTGDLSSHQYKDVEKGMDLILNSRFSDIMKQDDFIVIGGGPTGNTPFEIDMNVALNRTNADADRAFFLSVGNNTEDVTGTSLSDYAILGNKADIFKGEKGDDFIYGESGHDKLYGGDGDDTIFGGGRDDTIEGGTGDDAIFGESGTDTLKGGDGDDEITVSAGDTAYGGSDKDTFIISSDYFSEGSEIKIYGGTNASGNNISDDFDTIKLADGLEVVSGSLNANTDTDDDGLSSTSGTVKVTNGDDTISIAFSNIERTSWDTPVCFACGTHIETMYGEKPIETLKVGDMIRTIDHGYEPIKWIGSQYFCSNQLKNRPTFCPIKIPKNALGDGFPTTDLFVSQQHRMLMNSKITARIFDANEVLVPAKHLIGINGIELAERHAGVEYFHFLFEQHEIVYANGSASESLYIGQNAMKSLSIEAQKEILQIFPELKQTSPLPARKLPENKKIKLAIKRHMKNNQELFVDN